MTALAPLKSDQVRRDAGKIDALTNNLAGDGKDLTHFVPEQRVRGGDYRVLFEVEGAGDRRQACPTGRRGLHLRNATMITLHPEILSKNRRKEFVVLSYEESVALREEL
jgi:hypothetical protein